MKPVLVTLILLGCLFNGGAFAQEKTIVIEAPETSTARIGFKASIKAAQIQGWATIITGLLALTAGAFVLLASKQQSKDKERELQHNKEEARRIENMEYLAWLEISTDIIWRDLTRHEICLQNWLVMISKDASFSKLPSQPRDQAITALMPSIFNIDNESRRLYAKLPVEVKNLIREEPSPYKALFNDISFLNIALRMRDIGHQIPDECIVAISNSITNGWKNLIRKTHEGLEFAEPHIREMRKRVAESDGAMPYP